MAVLINIILAVATFYLYVLGSGRFYRRREPFMAYLGAAVVLDVATAFLASFKLTPTTLVAGPHVVPWRSVLFLVHIVTATLGMFGFIAGTPEEKKKIPSSPHMEIDNPNIGTIPDIMAGRWVGRADDRQISFLNNQGTQGLQFAAVGGTAYNLAKAKGLGHPLPLEWFTQNIRD